MLNLSLRAGLLFLWRNVLPFKIVPNKTGPALEDFPYDDGKTARTETEAPKLNGGESFVSSMVLCLTRDM